MVELWYSLVFIAYAVIGFVYSVKMENDSVLKQVYKAKSDRDWSEICYAIGMAWPLGFLINFVMRRRNETR